MQEEQQHPGDMHVTKIWRAAQSNRVLQSGAEKSKDCALTDPLVQACLNEPFRMTVGQIGQYEGAKRKRNRGFEV